jgi:hypothetical protein
LPVAATLIGKTLRQPNPWLSRPLALREADILTSCMREHAHVGPRAAHPVQAQRAGHASDPACRPYRIRRPKPRLRSRPVTKVGSRQVNPRRRVSRRCLPQTDSRGLGLVMPRDGSAGGSPFCSEVLPPASSRSPMRLLTCADGRLWRPRLCECIPGGQGVAGQTRPSRRRSKAGSGFQLSAFGCMGAHVRSHPLRRPSGVTCPAVQAS